MSLPFDIEEAQRSNILVAGCNYTGKTYLMASIEQLLRLDGWKTVVFDNAQTFTKISDIPAKHQIRPNQKIPIKANIAYDTSLLKRKTQIRFIGEVLRYYWLSRVNNGAKRWLMIFVEESELVMRSARWNEDILRVMSAGRNQKIRLCGTLTDLSLIDSAFIRLCNQIYFARFPVEENSRRKFRSMYGKQLTEQVSKLEPRQFIYHCNNSIKQVTIPDYKPNCEAQNIATLGNWSGNPVSFTNIFAGLPPL